jgi:hypothetical protein
MTRGFEAETGGGTFDGASRRVSPFDLDGSHNPGSMAEDQPSYEPSCHRNRENRMRLLVRPVAVSGTVFLPVAAK